MVKQSRVLDEVSQEADVRYAETRLARRASRARPRLAILLVLGGLGFALEAGIARSVWWALGAGLLVLVAFGIRREKLGATIAATLVAALAFLLPIVYSAVIRPGQASIVLVAFVALWGLAMLPDTVMLLRDHELRHAYGQWAARERT